MFSAVLLRFLSQVTPFHAPGSKGAALGTKEEVQNVLLSFDGTLLNQFSIVAEASTGVFSPAPPFASLSMIPTNAAIFGSILGVQRIACKSLELIRRRQDVWNDVFGFAVTYRYYTFFLGSSEKRLIMHNRVVGATVAMAIIYANLIV